MTQHVRQPTLPLCNPARRRCIPPNPPHSRPRQVEHCSGAKVAQAHDGTCNGDLSRLLAPPTFFHLLSSTSFHLLPPSSTPFLPRFPLAATNSVGRKKYLILTVLTFDVLSGQKCILTVLTFDVMWPEFQNLVYPPPAALAAFMGFPSGSRGSTCKK